MSAKPKATAAEPTFETAMDRLEAIVEQMESGKLPLEELIVRYEEGMNMVKVCQERLTAAEQKIEIIARDNAGQAIVKPFEPEAASNAPAPAPPRQNDDHNDDVSLF
jgi:exodeoxyribonuclease VII small subunit